MNQTPESNMADVPIRLLIVNLPIMLCDLLQSVFVTVPDIKVIEATNDVQHRLSVANGESVDIILLGSSREDKSFSAVAILESLLDRHEEAKVIIFTQKPDYQETVSLFRAGARGIFCSADLRFDLLCKSVRCVSQGQVWANNELLGYLVASLARPKSRVVTDSHGRRLLTTREQQVLHLLADGLSNHDLAAVLKISQHTIKNHLFRIYDKLGVSNRMEAVLYALTPRNLHPTPINANEAPSSNIRMIKAG